MNYTRSRRERETADVEAILRAARTYMDLGYEVVPLPYRLKAPIPAGLTGWRGRAANWGQLRRYIERGYRAGDGHCVCGGLALRMPEGVIGIDVDAYGGKLGDKSLAEFEEQCGGPFPETWITTSRDDTSGIRLFRVPIGEVYRANPFPGIEIIQRHHRYAVVWPSVHPSGRRYRWRSPDGANYWPNQAIEEVYPPEITGLPWLDGVDDEAY